MSDERNTNFNEDKEHSNFLRCGMPLGGLPARAAQVDDSPTDGDEPSLVYRAFTMGGSSAALLRTAATVSSKDLSIGSSPVVNIVERKVLSPPPAPVSIRYVDIERPLSFTHVLLPLQDGEVLRAVDAFLSTGGISSEHKHPQSNIYRCHTVVDCTIVRFDIRLVPGQEGQGVNVEFKRTLGPCELFARVYKQFKSSVGCEESTRSASPTTPSSLGEDCEDADPAEISRAVSAMALWVERDPVEALQCVGQFYLARNRHVTDSPAILASVCRVIESCQNLEDDCSMLTSCVAMSCVRQFMASAREMGSANEMLAEHVAVVAPGIAKAAMGKDLTARREAVGLLMELNPRFGADIRDRVAHMQGFSLDAAVCTPALGTVA